MQAEIYARGPISCVMDVTQTLLDYTGGVFTSREGKWLGKHAVEVTGWGVDEETNTPYWIVRNSWGTYWGENGWFRIAMGQNLLNIELLCSWGVPVIDF